MWNNNGFGGYWIIILIILFCGCGSWSCGNSGNNCCCGNSCGNCCCNSCNSCNNNNNCCCNDSCGC